MAWDINERGTIDLTPLLDWEAAVLYKTGCGLRLLFVHHEDAPETDPIVFQTVLTVEQAQSIARVLQQMVERILQPGSVAH